MSQHPCCATSHMSVCCYAVYLHEWCCISVWPPTWLTTEICTSPSVLNPCRQGVTLCPSAFSFGNSLCNSSILPDDCVNLSSSDPASPVACLFRAKSSSRPLHRNCSHITRCLIIVSHALQQPQCAMSMLNTGAHAIAGIAGHSLCMCLCRLL